MRHLRQLSGSFSVLLVLLVGRTALADNICNETVPSNRLVDGIPAYAQCDASTSSAIYSNNGVDTATTSGGTGWVRTQGSGGYQCTELAHRYLYFKWNVQSVPNGNAGVWCDGTIPNGLVKTTVPVHGDVIVFAPGSCGADATTGHVAVVDVVNSDSTVTFVEQNRAGRRSCAVGTAACFLHATANDGTVVDGGAPDSAAPDTGSAPGDAAGTSADLAADGRRRADASGAGGAAGTGGATGTGGMAGTGGAVTTTSSGGQRGSGGASGTGGVVGSGGSAGSGGETATTVASTGGSGGETATTVASAGGSGGTSSSATASPDVSASNGCACRLAERGSPARGYLAGLALLALAMFVRRRRRP
jgi:MYXO-CTERM domain-containing protein